MVSIYKSLPIVARALADQLNIDITVGGTDAFASVANGKASINIPYYKNAEDFSDAILGFTVHEAAHIRFTEFGMLHDAFTALCDKPLEVRNAFDELIGTGRYNQKVLHSLWNIAEDLRIERAIVRVFPGSIRYLKAVRSFVFDGNIQPCDIPVTIYLDTMLLCGRELYHGFNTHSEVRRNEFISVFGQELLDKSLDILGLAVFAETTLGCLDVARQLYDLVIEALKDEKNEDSEENNDDQSDSPDSQTAQPEGKSDESDDNASQSGAGTSDDSEVNGDKAASDSDAVSENTVSDESTPDASGISGNASESEDSSITGQKNHDPFSDVSDEEIKLTVKDITEKFNDLMQDNLTTTQKRSVVNPFNVAPAKTDNTGNDSVERGIKMSSGLRQSLHGLLQGNQHIRRTYKETGNKIEGRLLASVLTGNTKVFRHKSKAIAFNSAFTILLDSSTSMRGDMIEAEAAVISLLYALENQTGVTTSAFHFPHKSGNCVGVLKARKQSLRQAVNANHFGISPTGSTPMSESLWPAFADLVNTVADQRILIVCTDGEPDSSDTVIEMIKDAKSEGIIVIGIGFGQANKTVMTQLFGKSGVAVGSLEKLRSTLFDVARSVLVSR